MATPRKKRRSTASTTRRASLSGTPTPAASRRRPMRPVGLAVIAATILGGGYLIKKGIDKVVGSGGSDDSLKLPASTSTSTVTKAKVTVPKISTNAGSFPLKHGQKGELIRTLQTAILAKAGPAATEIRNSGGADGVFGDGMARALAALGEYSVRSVDQTAFNRILGLSATQSAGVPALAPPAGSPAAVLSVRPLSLVNAADPNGKNIGLPEVVTLRNQLIQAVERYDPTAAAYAVAAARNVAGYKALNYNSMGIRWPKEGIDVRQTIATKLGKMFPGNMQVRTALLSIGLTLDAAGIWRADF